MKIAAFYSDSPFAGWVQCEGFADVLRHMGHEVTAIAIPPVTQVTQELADKVNKPIEDCDVVIVSGPEHLRKWIQHFYHGWNKLKCPKIGWYHESFVREDYSLDYANFEGMFDFHFFPDRADAEKYKGTFLPLGVDTHIFKTDYEPGYGEARRDIDIAFIGLMYPKRQRFVEELTPHLGDIKIKYMTACQSERGLIPAIGVWDADGLNIRRSMELLAETYRRIKVFVTFPSLSNVLVAKVLESMACGCILVAPKQPVDLLGGYLPYEGAYQCAEMIRRANVTINPSVVANANRMELRFEEIFRKCQISLSRVEADSLATISSAT
jgi:glycosyltransferase involved in cell wall biosynthesis